MEDEDPPILREPFMAWTHQGRELEMMREGKKPLAFFSAKDPFDGLMIEEFKELVRSGAVVMEIRTWNLHWRERDGRKTVDVAYTAYYALPGEEWRIGRMHDIKTGFGRHGYTKEDEITMSMLLGYTPEQAIEYADYMYRRISDRRQAIRQDFIERGIDRDESGGA